MARKMKDSGIEWIGEIPEGWELTKVKRIFDIGRGRVISQQELTSVGYPVYSSQTKNNGCLGYISTYDFDKSQLTWTTDGVNAGTVFFCARESTTVLMFVELLLQRTVRMIYAI